MELGAGTAGAGLTHHPEVVLFVAVDNVHGGIESGSFEDGCPVGVCLIVECGWIAFFRSVDGGVEAFRRKAPDLRQEFPSPFNGFFLEVVAEGPVAEHLEEGVVVGVVADVFEVVVFTAGADALLRVGCAGWAVGCRLAAEKVGHELVHPGVGEEQSG